MKTKLLRYFIALTILSLFLMPMPAFAEKASPFVGHWQAIDVDGSDIRLTIGGPPNGPFNITWTESYISFCDGGPGIVKGRGWLAKGDANVLEADLRMTCFTTGDSLDFSIAWIYDSGTDTISSGFITWHRPSARSKACLPPPFGLTGWWTGDGDANDLIAGRSGVFQGDATTGSGLVNLAFHLDGDGDFIEVPHDPALDFRTNDFTVDLWVNFNDTAGEQVLVEKWIQSDPVQGWTLTKLEGDVLRLTMGDGQGVEVDLDSQPLSIRPGIWYHFAATREGTAVTLYINGEAIAYEPEIEVMNLSSTSSLKFGQRGSPEEAQFNLNGRIDEVELLLGTSLPADQIMALYQAGSAGKCKDEAFRTPRLDLRVNYGYDWVESFYEAGHTAWITVTENDGVTVKATAEMFTEPQEFWGGESGFQTQASDWVPSPPDIQPYDRVFGRVDNGQTTHVQIGEISGEIDLEGDSIQGTIFAPWFSSEVSVECYPWGAPEPVVMKFDTVLPNGEDPYSCSWFGEWDIQPGQDVGVGYFGPDGHWVANAFLKRETIVVRSSADSGPGSLRQALQDAQMGDTIIFDPAVFPPDAPETIAVTSGLPQIGQGYLTIDASNAGVVLDGSQLPRDTWIPGLEIVSDGNIIRGLQVINFTGTGIVAAFHGRNNTIGGDRNIGSGPTGQGNLSSGNDFGIGIWDFAANNIVTGNIVGTDISGAGDFGNRYSGIWVTGGGMKNVIGPDNIIAYSGTCGIEVEGSSSLANTLTQNSIHDNGGVGICLLGGGNTGLSAPFIVGFDLAGGLISGSTCANCTVEIFYDSGDEGAAYEGQAVADRSGIFTFNKGAAFTNTHLTLTATDVNGNTSQFSRPIGGDIRVIVLQEGNSLPKSRLLTWPSSELADNRTGLSYAGSGLWLGGFENILDEITDLGAKRVHTSLYEIEPPISWTVSEYDIPPEFDRFVDDLAENGVAIDYLLHFWDKAGYANGEELSTPRFQTSEQVQDFLDYVRFVVGHFKGRIQYYSIWSEPDYCGDGGIKCILPQDYIELAKQVIPVIREEDPQAKVVSAPNVLFFDREYLFTLLKSDVVKQFDVISWHPMYDVAPNSEFYGNYYYEYPSIIEEIKQTASSSGFQGEFWGTEISWCSEEFPWCHPADQPWGQQKTDLLAAKYYARGIVMHLGLDMGTSVGGFESAAPWSYPTMRNLNTIMAGAKPLEITVEIESEATNIMSFGFSLPDGNRLFALWTDGVAVDDDPGVNATLTFPDSFAQSVIGIDVLHGFEQELVTETENDNLIVRDLLVKDYPILLRLTD